MSVANAVAFLIARPGVNDLWAARARASAVSNGVGLTYWFGWFAGGSTPGNYSVLTPWLSALISAELVGALSAVAICVLAPVLLRGTAHPIAGSAVATIAAGINLWSGRIPFLAGSAVAVGALIAVRARRPVLAAVLAVLSVLSSPVSGAFLGLGLAAAFVSVRDLRRISMTTIGAIVVGLGGVAIAFGNPGPQPFSRELCVEIVAAMILFLMARPPEQVRVAIWLSIITAAVLLVVPNGMGSNFGRLAWFCVPVAVVAMSSRRLSVALLLVAPALIAGAEGTVADVRDASARTASEAYYKPLADQFDRLPRLQNYRVEVVAEGEHAAYDALLNHAMLARGWETQEDHALNSSVLDEALDPVTYKVWLDNNAVGYVALPAVLDATYPEYALVSSGKLSYLREIWRNEDWTLFEVINPSPVVGPPARLVAHTQSRLTIQVPSATTFSVRVRWSKYLHASERTGTYDATVIDDGTGWTRITTTGPGTYYLHGSLKKILG